VASHRKAIARRSGWAAAACGSLLLLAACAGPQFVQNPESGIELRWPKGRGEINLARQLAQARCAESEKRAVLMAEFADQDESLARFICQEAPGVTN